MCEGFSPPSGSLIPYRPAGCPAIQLNSDTIYLQFTSDPKVKGSVHKLPPCPHSDFRCQSQVQLVTCASDWPTVNGRFPQSPPGFNNLLEWLTELRKAVYFVKGFQSKMEPEHVKWRISCLRPNETKLKRWDWYSVNALKPRLVSCPMNFRQEFLPILLANEITPWPLAGLPPLCTPCL